MSSICNLINRKQFFPLLFGWINDNRELKSNCSNICKWTTKLSQNKRFNQLWSFKVNSFSRMNCACKLIYWNNNKQYQHKPHNPEHEPMNHIFNWFHAVNWMHSLFRGGILFVWTKQNKKPYNELRFWNINAQRESKLLIFGRSCCLNI